MIGNIKCVLFLVSYLTYASLMEFSMGGSKARHLKWEVANMFWTPDGVESVVMGINGQYPGPTIRARVGDTLVVELTNGLHTEGVVIHWHGIRQLGSPWADGTASISQCVINPGETFVYRFKVDKSGTYFYHGHYGMQRSAGLYGSLIVDVEEGQKEIFHYDGEFNLLLSDWWHEDIHSQEVGLSSKPFRWVGEPQSLLINGRGQFNCSLAAHFSNDSTSSLCKFRGNEQWAPQILHVLPNKTYRLRLASATSLASLNLAIKDHKMTVIEADGNYVEPFTITGWPTTEPPVVGTDMDIYSGETYSILLTTNQNPNHNYFIAINVRGREPKTPPGLTILNYTPTKSSILPIHPPPIPPLWDNYTHSKIFTSKIKSLKRSRNHPPLNHDRRILLLGTQTLIDGFIKWSINNVSLKLPSTPYLGSIKYGLKHAFDDSISPPENFASFYNITIPPLNPNSSYGNGVYRLDFNTTVDVVLQNANALKGNVSEIHPWHLHGHDFWVLGYGEGRYSKKEGDKLVKELRRKGTLGPPVRNTAVVFGYGWTMIRFVADNPGVWAFHCHIEPHLHMGMGVVFAYGVVEFVKEIPRNAMDCGLTGKMFMGEQNP